MKNKNTALNTAVQATTILFVVIFSIWASMGFKIDVSVIDKNFIVKVGINLVVSLLCYNIIFSMFFGNLARNERCRYYITVATKKVRVGKIYENNRHDDLKAAVDTQNDNDLLELRNYKLRSVCDRLSYDDIKSIKASTLNEQIKTWANMYTLSKTTQLKLKRVIKCILSGSVKVDKLTPKDILTERESQKLTKNRLKLYARQRAVRRNLVRSVKVLITAVVFAAITFTPSDVSIWQTIIKQLSLFLSAACSGLFAAVSESKYITDMYDEHNKFILQNLGINDTYTPTEN